MDQSNLFTPVATTAEIEDKNSWINNTFEWPQKPFDDLCCAIGQSIASWAQLESRLFTIYMVSVQSASYRASSAIWETQTGFRQRLEMTSNSLTANENISFDIQAWDKLKERCRKKSLRRNELAHGTMYYDHKEKNASRKFFLATPTALSDLERLYTSDALSLRDAFALISDDLLSFWKTLRS